MLDSVSLKVLRAVENSPQGIASLDVLESLRLCGRDTLKTILSRLNKAGRILRLKRGVYSANPLRDSFAAAQAAFNGYVGFSSALYLHGLIAELPLTVTVVTRSVSGEKRIGGFEFKAVALKEKAVGFERRDGRVVSTRAKTLFDCLLVPRYSIESEKLAQAFRQARLSKNEWKEFDFYVKKMVSAINAKRFTEAKKSITGR